MFWINTLTTSPGHRTTNVKWRLVEHHWNLHWEQLACQHMLLMVFTNWGKLMLQLQDTLEINLGESLKSQESPKPQSKTLAVEFQSCISKKKDNYLLPGRLNSFLTLQASFLKCPNHQTHLLHCQIHEWKRIREERNEHTVELSEMVVQDHAGFFKHKKQMSAWQEGRSLNNSIPLKAVGKLKYVSAFFSLITAVLLAQLCRIYRILRNKVSGYCWFNWFLVQETCCCTVSICIWVSPARTYENGPTASTRFDTGREFLTIAMFLPVS